MRRVAKHQRSKSICNAWRPTRRGSDVDFDALLAQCPLNLTGADFYVLCSGAMARSLQRRVQQIEQHLEHADGGKLTPQMISQRKLRTLFDAIDTDGDRSLGWDEFLQLFETGFGGARKEDLDSDDESEPESEEEAGGA